MYPNNKLNQFCKLFGLVPISLNPHTQRGLTAYSWILITVLTLNTMFSFSIDIYGAGFIVSSFVMSTVYLTVVGAHMTAIAESLFKRESHQEFFAKLHEIDDIFRIKLQHILQIEKKRKQLIWKYSILTFVVLFHLLLYMGSILSHEYTGFFWYGFISVLYSRLRYIQVTIYVELISFRLVNMNQLLRQIATLKLHQKSRILDLDYSAVENPERLFALKLVYTKLTDVTDCLNDIFGWSILTLVVHHALDLTCNIYWVILTLEDFGSDYLFNECYATILPLAVLLTFYCHTCHKCMSESVVAKHLLQKMLASMLMEHENYLINQFLLQIHHQPIVIHAKRFFNVNLKLLASISSSIVGYLMILLQFRYTENEI